jgi:hypothetical protein
MKIIGNDWLVGVRGSDGQNSEKTIKASGFVDAHDKASKQFPGFKLVYIRPKGVDANFPGWTNQQLDVDKSVKQAQGETPKQSFNKSMRNNNVESLAANLVSRLLEEEPNMPAVEAGDGPDSPEDLPVDDEVGEERPIKVTPKINPANGKKICNLNAKQLASLPPHAIEALRGLGYDI